MILIITVLVCFCYLLRIVSWLFLWRPIQEREAKYRSDILQVSIVIACRDEYEILEENIGMLLEQNFPAYEVILVDDNSVNAIPEGIRTLAKENKIILIKNDSGQNGKKAALEIGIEKASGQWIGLTDADCKIQSQNWISSMMSKSESRDVIVGYSPYAFRKGLLNLMIRFEAFYIAIQYFSSIMRHRPYMAVGRNLFFRKEFFNNLNGFAAHNKLISGSDDLFIRDAVRARARVGYNFSADSHVISAPKEDLLSLVRQKRRHITSAFKYNKRDIILLFFLQLSHVGLYPGLLALGLFYEPFLAITALGIYYLILIYRITKWSELLDFDRSYANLILADLMLAIFYLSIAIFVRTRVSKW